MRGRPAWCPSPAPNRIWLADITYLPTGEGWLYLAAILDLATRKGRRLGHARSHANRADHGSPDDGHVTPATSGWADPTQRSRMMERSNWARAPKMWKNSSPAFVVVSIASVSDRKPMPRAFTGRPRRSAVSWPGQAIELPDHKCVALAHIVQGRLQLRPILFGARRPFDKGLMAPGSL